MEEPVNEGACFCEAVRFRVIGAPRSLAFCHCQSCRRASGAPFVAWGSFPSAGFEITHGAPASFASSPGVTRGFCARCGTQLTYAHSERADEIDVTLVSLRNAAAYPPQRHVYTEHRLPWVEIGDGLPQYARFMANSDTE